VVVVVVVQAGLGLPATFSRHGMRGGLYLGDNMELWDGMIFVLLHLGLFLCYLLGVVVVVEENGLFWGIFGGGGWMVGGGWFGASAYEICCE